MTKIQLARLLPAIALSIGATASAAPLEINFWHPNFGPIEEALQSQINAFNSSQSDYKVVATARGTYDETLNSGVAAFRAKKQPHILVVIGAGTQNMISSNAIVPVQELMSEQGYKVDWGGYVQPVLNYYRTRDGKLLSLPFSVSTPVLWYNKAAFAKAGIAKPPETWDDMGDAAGKLRAAVFECGFTTSWPNWVFVDSYATIHNFPIATKHNGLDGLDAEFTYNKSPVVKHMERLQTWAQDGRYVYSGRQSSSATPAFTSGKCGMMIQSSALYAGLVKSANFEFAAAPMPYEKGSQPRNSLIGGGSLWVLKGHKPEEYKGVAAFMAKLTSTDQQVKWHKDTGYIPLTVAAYEQMTGSGYYTKNPSQEVAIKQLQRGTPTLDTMTVRLGSSSQYVTALEEEMEFVWTKQKTAQQAMDDAVRRGNVILRRFEQQQKGAGN